MHVGQFVATSLDAECRHIEYVWPLDHDSTRRSTEVNRVDHQQHVDAARHQLLHQPDAADADVQHPNRRGKRLGEQPLGDDDTDSVVRTQDITEAGHQHSHVRRVGLMPAVEQDRDNGADEDMAMLESRLGRYPADHYPAQHATAAFHLGTAQLQRGRVGDALSALRAAYDIFGRLGMQLEQAKALTMYGVALREAGRSDQARQTFEDAVRAFGALEQPAEEAAASYDLGLVLHEQGDTVAAQQAMAYARAVFLQAGHLAQAGAAAREQGASLLASGQAGSALPLLEEAATLTERGGDLPGLGAAANVLGLAYLASEDAAAAVSALTRAVGAFPRTMRPTEHAMAKANLALAYAQADNPARARLAARQALALPGAEPPVRAQAQQVLDRLCGATQLDLLAVLDVEPLERWPAIVREEAVRWCDASSAERLDTVGGFLDGLLSRPATTYDLAESLLAVLLELPPGPYDVLVAAIAHATDTRAPEESERIRAVVGSAMARFAIPQWQRLAASLNAAATATGQPGGWR